MDPIWQTLPHALLYNILAFVDDIDVRLEFKIPPRRFKNLPSIDIKPRHIASTFMRHVFQYQIPLPKNKQYLITYNYGSQGIQFEEEGKFRVYCDHSHKTTITVHTIYTETIQDAEFSY